MMPGVMTGKIWARGGPFDGCGVSLLPGATTLGRDSLNDIVMENPAVSRRHARIQANAQGYWIQDLGSRNGTFVNGRQVTRAPVKLNAEDEIKFGAQSGDATWIFREVEISESHFENTQATMAISLEEMDEPSRAETAGVPAAAAPEPAPQGQKSAPCQSFKKNEKGAWTCVEFAAISVPPIEIEVSKGTTFSPGVTFMGIDVATWLDDNCEGTDRAISVPLG